MYFTLHFSIFKESYKQTDEFKDRYRWRAGLVFKEFFSYFALGKPYQSGNWVSRKRALDLFLARGGNNAVFLEIS